MPVLANSRHEHFAQSVATGLSIVRAYTSAGYSKNSAASNAARIRGNEGVSARIADLKTTNAEGVVKFGIWNRSARLHVLQNQLDGMLNLQRARAFEYSDHPGGATGTLVKDYRGKNAEQEIWKFDAALVAMITNTLKQAAIKEGQWTEKRQVAGEIGISEIMQRLNAGRQRVVDAKAARDAAALTKLGPEPTS